MKYFLEKPGDVSCINMEVKEKFSFILILASLCAYHNDPPDCANAKEKKRKRNVSEFH